MKDYRLSEIKNHDWHENWDVNDDITKGHREYEFLRELQHDLEYRDISPRDMIELPCKMEYEGKYGKCWKVYYRNVLDGTIDNQGFYDKTQADEFLQELKNGKV